MNTIIFQTIRAGMVVGIALFAFAGEVFAAPVLSIPSEVVQTTETTATLVSHVENPYKTSLVWFEWGDNFALSPFTTSGMTRVFDRGFFRTYLTGLKADTVYYYRSASSEGGTTVYSPIISFRTKGAVTPTAQGTVITQGTTYPTYQSYYSTYPTYTTTASLPSVTTNSPSSVSQASATLNGFVYPNNASTDAWFEWGTTPSFGNYTGSVNYGTGATSYSSVLWNLSYNTSYYFRAVARNSQGMVYGSTLSFTVPSAGATQTTGVSGVSPEVTTLFATELTGTAAKLNGLVSTSANQASSAWFEWGTSASLGNTTQSLNVGMLPVVKHSDTISGLVFGNTYYYRIVAENPYGKVYGTIMSFVSDGTFPDGTTAIATGDLETPAPKPVAKPTVMVIGRGSAEQSLVALTIDGGAEAIAAGEKRSYRVSWKNKDANALKNVILRVAFPKAISIESATKGSLSSTENVVVVDMKTLASGEKGETTISAVVNRGIKVGDTIVVTANMVYTSASGVQGDAIAYVTHRVEAAPATQGANIFGAGPFIPTTLFEWILLLILILILVLLGNHLYGKFAGEGH